MKIFKNLFLKNKKRIVNNESINVIDKYSEIGKLVKEARIRENISIEELSVMSKIPGNTIKAIENNIEHIRPKYPFIRSILFKLEECLSLKKNNLVGLLIKETKIKKKTKEKFLVSKFDLINNWHGSLLYFLILVCTIFVLKRYFFSNISIIEIQNIEEKIKVK
ncbi:MAG: transcriptional regulator [Flavobacteriales bacterium]|nr:transcriptional regulator [Flavobacteriales bacterium]